MTELKEILEQIDRLKALCQNQDLQGKQSFEEDCKLHYTYESNQWYAGDFKSFFIF